MSNACSDHDLQGIFDAFDSFNMGITPVGVGLAVSPECTQGAPLTQPPFTYRLLIHLPFSVVLLWRYRMTIVRRGYFDSTYRLRMTLDAFCLHVGG